MLTVGSIPQCLINAAEIGNHLILMSGKATLLIEKSYQLQGEFIQ